MKKSVINPEEELNALKAQFACLSNEGNNSKYKSDKFFNSEQFLANTTEYIVQCGRIQNLLDRFDNGMQNCIEKWIKVNFFYFIILFSKPKQNPKLKEFHKINFLSCNRK